MGNGAPKTEGDSSTFVRYIRGLLFGATAEPTLREQIEDVIDEAEEEAGASGADGRPDDLATIEREMLRNLLHFGERQVDDVAVPRGDIIAIDESASFDDLIALFAEADHSRLPVYRDTLDNVVGMIHIKDAFAVLARKEKPPKSLEKLVRQPLFVPQAMSAMELLVEMRAKRTHLAIVVDEYAGTEGLVTIEDLVEEIVGDIEDEHDDAPEELLVARGDGVWDGDARVEIEELARLLDPRFGEDDHDVDTLGGLVVMLAGHVPQQGEVMAHASGWMLEVLQADDRHVERVRLHAPAVTVDAEHA